MIKDNAGWFYMGLTDDRVRAYPRNGTEIFRNPVDQVVHATLIGRRPLIHQSATLIQYDFVDDLIKGEKSALRALSENHQLRIISSEGDFDYWIRRSIEKGVYSAHWHLNDGQSITVSDYVKAHKGELQREARYLLDNELFLAFPNTDPSSVLYEALLMIRDWNPGEIPANEWNELFEEFTARFDKELSSIDSAGRSGTDYPATRTHWEAAVRHLFDGKSDRKSRLMAIVNEHYHGTFAATLSRELGDENLIGVATIATETYQGFSPNMTQPDDNSTFNDSVVPVVHYNAQKIRNGLCDHARELFGDSNLGKARKDFIEALGHPTDSVRCQRLPNAAVVYEEELARTFGYWDDLKTKQVNINDHYFTVICAVTAGTVTFATEFTKAALGDIYSVETAVHTAIGISAIGAVIGRYGDPFVSKVNSLATRLRRHNYDELRPEIGWKSYPVMVERNSNMQYLNRLFAMDGIRTFSGDSKLPLLHSQLRTK